MDMLSTETPTELASYSDLLSTSWCFCKLSHNEQMELI